MKDYEYIPKTDDLKENLIAVKRWLLDCLMNKVDSPDWRVCNMLLTHLHDFVVLPQRELIEELYEALTTGDDDPDLIGRTREMLG